jgi:hypothetical protein
MTSRKRFTRTRRPWFWKWRRHGPPAIVEQQDDGRWRITIGRQQVGLVGTREAAEHLVDTVEKARSGGDGDR